MGRGAVRANGAAQPPSHKSYPPTKKGAYKYDRAYGIRGL